MTGTRSTIVSKFDRFLPVQPRMAGTNNCIYSTGSFVRELSVSHNQISDCQSLAGKAANVRQFSHSETVGAESHRLNEYPTRHSRPLRLVPELSGLTRLCKIVSLRHVPRPRLREPFPGGSALSYVCSRRPNRSLRSARLFAVRTDECSHASRYPSAIPVRDHPIASSLVHQHKLAATAKAAQVFRIKKRLGHIGIEGH